MGCVRPPPQPAVAAMASSDTPKRQIARPEPMRPDVRIVGEGPSPPHQLAPQKNRRFDTDRAPRTSVSRRDPRLDGVRCIPWIPRRSRRRTRARSYIAAGKRVPVPDCRTPSDPFALRHDLDRGLGRLAHDSLGDDRSHRHLPRRGSSCPRTAGLNHWPSVRSHRDRRVPRSWPLEACAGTRRARAADGALSFAGNRGGDLRGREPSRRRADDDGASSTAGPPGVRGIRLPRCPDHPRRLADRGSVNHRQHG
jgi:hypothetical protein